MFTQTIILSAALIAGGDAAPFLVEATGGGYRTQHSLRLEVTAAEPYQRQETAYREARFNDVPFAISLGAFTAADGAIMVHAEQVMDGSGAANYERYALVDWPAPGFRLKPAECHDIPAEVVAQEHDLAWLRDHGFDPSGNVWIEQYFLSGNAYNDEVVISLIHTGTACSDTVNGEAELARLRTAIRVEPAP